MNICKDCTVKNEAENYCSEEMKNICVTHQMMPMCQDCTFRKEEVLFKENEPVIKVCRYEAICERAIKSCIHSQVQWEPIAQDFHS